MIMINFFQKMSYIRPSDTGQAGRVIGKNGRIIGAIKTIAYASASKTGKKIEVTVDSF